MDQILILAAKSLLIAGSTLLILRLVRARSAADRSLVAHLGLLGLAALPVAAFFLPPLEIAAPAFLAPQVEPAAAANSFVPAVAVPPTAALGSEAVAAVPPVDWVFWIYVLPAAVLALLTLVAVGRLAILKARANVLVDPHWLSALAQAQKRMGFKNGTALLTSDELRSPISWGLLRPVILLNSNAVEARSEAEAIIAHELAHVTRLDWAKLLVARLVVAFFWFNPLVWLLAREAHQLREEAADDAVLAHDIPDTDYAQLLVGVARHECRGMLIGAHGVAPGRKSLMRRITRVLDAASTRAPGGWRWASAAAFFAAGVAVPVAAMQLVEPSPVESELAIAEATAPAQVLSVNAAATPVAGAGDVEAGMAMAHAAPGGQPLPQQLPGPAALPHQDAEFGPQVIAISGRQIAMIGPRGPVAIKTDIDRAVERKAVGATPEYAAAIRAASPRMRNIGHDDIIAFAALGVTPGYIRALAAAGYEDVRPDDVAGAMGVGIDADYVREMTAAGYRGVPISQLVGMKAVGVTPADVVRYRRAGRGLPSVDQMIAIKALGLEPKDMAPEADP